MGNTERAAGLGSVHAMGIWLASVDYRLAETGTGDVDAKIHVTNGERDLSPDSIFAEEMVLELEDGRWGRIKTLGGNTVSGVYRVRILGGLLAPPAQRTFAEGNVS